MNTTLKFIIYSICLIFIGSCEKIDETVQIISTQFHYNNTEIFAEENFKIYGKWNLYRITGGDDGSGAKPDFDYIEFKKHAAYQVIGNNTTLEYGEITIIKENTDQLIIQLKADNNSEMMRLTSAGYEITFEAKNLLCLSEYGSYSGFCYHFIRES